MTNQQLTPTQRVEQVYTNLNEVAPLNGYKLAIEFANELERVQRQNVNLLHQQGYEETCRAQMKQEQVLLLQERDDLLRQVEELTLKVAAKPTWDDVNHEITRVNSMRKAFQNQVEENQQLRSENAALKADKERLLVAAEKALAEFDEDECGALLIPTADELRQAIDAART